MDHISDKFKPSKYRYLKRFTRDWRTRLYMEFSVCGGYLVTLTYDNEHLPDTEHEGEQSKKDFIDFIKRCREHIRYHNITIHGRFSYYAVTEHGGEGTHRLHIHAFLFGIKSRILFKALVNDKWKNGFTNIGSYADMCSMGYMTKYIHKRVLQDNKEWRMMSNGIGDSFMTDRIIEYYRAHPSRRFYIRGELFIFPRRYMYFLYKEKTKVQVVRKVYISDSEHNQSYVYKHTYKEVYLPREEWQTILDYDEWRFRKLYNDTNALAPPGDRFFILPDHDVEDIPRDPYEVSFYEYLENEKTRDEYRKLETWLSVKNNLGG